MNQIINYFVKNSKAIVTYILGFYLVIIIADISDIDKMNIYKVYGFWLCVGLYLGFYWSDYVERQKKKQKPPKFRILKPEGAKKEKS